MAKGGVLMAVAVSYGAPTVAQQFPIDPNASDSTDSPANQGEALRDVGTNADAGTGELGRRQTRNDAAPNIDPSDRLDTRIENRVQNRIRNRIDRTYDPTANATAPFKRAEQSNRRNTPRSGAR